MKKFVCLAVVLLMAVSGSAVDYTTVTTETVHWNVASGDWMTAANWLDEAGGGTWGIPGQGSSNGGLAKIAGGVCNLTSSSQPTGSVAGLYIGGTSNANLNISGNMTVAGISYMGAGSGVTSTISQTAGSVAFSAAVNFGQAGNSAYNISGGTLALSSAVDDFGSSGNGVCTLTQTGGTITDTGVLNFGDDAGSKGEYYVSGTGSYSGAEIRVGNYGEGYMNIANGASVTTSGYMHLALQATGKGVVDMSGGSLTVNGAQLRIGARGEGIFNQTGGSLNVHRIYIGYADTADGTYNLLGGSYFADVVSVVNYNAEWNILGSDITSVRTAKLDLNQTGAKLVVKLDDNGSTLIECFGVKANGSLDEGCEFADGAILEVGTLSTFDGQIGDVYDIIWSAMGITLQGSLNFVNAGAVQFSYDIVDDAVRGGQILQVTVVPEPATVLLLTSGGLLFMRHRRK